MADLLAPREERMAEEVKLQSGWLMRDVQSATRRLEELGAARQERLRNAPSEREAASWPTHDSSNGVGQK